MDVKLSQIFKDTDALNPSPELERAVLRRIELLAENKIKRARVWMYAGFAGASVSFVWAIVAFGGSILQSEFWSIISLVFSDAKIVLANWNDFWYSVLETFPTVSLIAMLIPTAVALWLMSIWSSLSRRENYQLRFHH
ncbi:hypothetical protein EPO05_02275 [Patescibacteria group bacterium]|nr:MAG: hypothetical protein EPO05_02275 [Patescibacteria group bacterium]